MSIPNDRLSAGKKLNRVKIFGKAPIIAEAKDIPNFILINDMETLMAFTSTK